MIGYAPFLGQVPLVGLGQFFGPCELFQRFMQQVAQSIAYENRAAQQALARGDNNGAASWAAQANESSAEWEKWKKKYDDCLRAQPVPTIQELPPPPLPPPSHGPAYPVVYPFPSVETPSTPPPPPPPVQTPRGPMRTGNIPEGAYLPTPTTGTQQAQGLPCPAGQYRPPGGGWCVPIPEATAYRGIPTIPVGGMFSGFGGGTPFTMT